MKGIIINDLDHFNIINKLEKNDVEYLENLQEIMIKSFGKEECLLHSNLEKYKPKRCKPIKFPFFRIKW